MMRIISFLLLAWLQGISGVKAVVMPTFPAGDTTITIRAVMGLQYDVVRFAVKPNTRVRIILQNADDMAHNLVLTKPAKRLEVVNAALALDSKGPALNYIPKTANVLGAIQVLSPGAQGELIWTAPSTEGVFPYVCTYPGHGFVMFGALYVTAKPLPPLKGDPNVPEQALEETPHAVHQIDYTDRRPSPHPYPVELPVLYRTFMPESGPATIVVVLPNEQSYCWDAGSSRLRYAWQGYVDNSEQWHGNGKRLSKVVGDVYFRAGNDFPIHLGDPGKAPNEVLYKGYRVIDRYPHFTYTVDGTEVTEVIREAGSGNGLVREFRMAPVSGDVFFTLEPQNGITYTASTGKIEGNMLRLTPQQARQFTITIKAQKIAKL
jgi:azurin